MLAIAKAMFGERPDIEFMLGVLGQVVTENEEMPQDELMETLNAKLESPGYKVILLG